MKKSSRKSDEKREEESRGRRRKLFCEEKKLVEEGQLVEAGRQLGRVEKRGSVVTSQRRQVDEEGKGRSVREARLRPCEGRNRAGIEVGAPLG